MFRTTFIIQLICLLYPCNNFILLSFVDDNIFIIKHIGEMVGVFPILTRDLELEP